MRNMRVFMIVSLLTATTILADTPNGFNSEYRQKTESSGIASTEIPDGSYVIENGFIKAGVSADGTFGVGSGDSPGFMFDENGEGNYGTDDYITPGTPFEYFTVKIGESIWTNNNSSYTSPAMSTTVTQSEDGTIEVESIVPDQMRVHQTYVLTGRSEIINVTVEIENISGGPLADVKFARGIDPDVDVIEHDTYVTENSRGWTNGSLTVPPEDIVYSLGSYSQKALSLYSSSIFPHNTAVTSGWSEDPSFILEGGDDGTGDWVIAVAFDLGSFAEAEQKTFTFKYVFGKNIEEAIKDITAPKKYDFTSDKYNDILFYNHLTGGVKLWALGKTDILEEITILESSNTNLKVHGIGDLNKDGYPDILLHNPDTRVVRVWVMDGTHRVANEGIFNNINSNLRIIGVSDINGDGKNDIVFYNINTRMVRYWPMDGIVRNTGINLFQITNPYFLFEAVGDMNADNKPDFMFRNVTTGAVWVWLWNGSGEIDREHKHMITERSSPNIVAKSLGDYDDDGQNDILWYNKKSGTVFIWKMQGIEKDGINISIGVEADPAEWEVAN